MLGTILLVIVILMLLGALPTWPHSRQWGYYSERRAWPGPGDSDHPAALGSDLIAEPVWCHAPQTLPTA